MKPLSPEILLFASLGIALVPLMIAVGTCYLKFSIVLSLLRSGFGTQQAPSTAMVMALSLVMSMVVMQPVLSKTAAEMSEMQKIDLTSVTFSILFQRSQKLLEPWRSFLLQHSGERELAVFGHFAEENPSEEIKPVDRDKASIVTAIAAFVLSEIKKGFTLAFFLLIPFFVIDLIVSNVLVAMGLTMMSPVIISLPLKILLFVSTDGWLLLAQNLIKAYQ